MRIAYVCADSGVPVFGSKGASIHVQEVIRALVRRGERVDLFARSTDGPIPADLHAIHVPALPRIPRGSPAAREQAALAANQDLRDALEAAGPFDLMYERYSLWSFAGMEYVRDHGVPGVLEVNAPLIEEQTRYRSLVDRAGAERVAERVFAAASVLLAVSREIAGYLNAYPAARGKVHVVPNAVNPDRFSPGVTPTCPAAPGTFTVGFVGSLKPWHGLSVLVEAFSILHARGGGWRLLIVGDGPERSDVEDAVVSRGVRDAVQFTGAVPPSEIPGLLSSMDVAVASYPNLSRFYFSPLKVYEYMAAGLPVVASRIGQLSDLIEDGENGLLCPPDDARALAAEIARLRAEPDRAARLGRAARATVLRDRTWDAVVNRMLQLAGVESVNERCLAEVSG
jgi:glycosyltransferase involved in cell wall biosynthesis